MNKFIIELFKFLLCLKICRGLKPPKSPKDYGPGVWNVKQEDKGMDQTLMLLLLQCDYESANLIK